MELEMKKNLNKLYITRVTDEQFEEILEMKVTKVLIPVREGRNIAILIESAVANHNLKLSGFNSAKEFEKKVYEFIQNQNKENV